MKDSYQVYGVFEGEELVYIGATTTTLLVRLGKLYSGYGAMGSYMREKGREQFTIRCLYSCKCKKTMFRNERELINRYKPKMNIKNTFKDC